jgi:cytochrome c
VNLVSPFIKVTLAIVAAVISTAATADEFGDPVAGEKIYRQCKSCHEVGSGAKHRIGPHLNGIFGRQAAAHEDFRYSKALVKAGTTGLEWHADTLEAFIENPRALASATRMSFKGIEKRQDRLDVIAYLRQFSDNPANIPEADPTATPTDRGLDPAILALQGDPEYGEYLSSECTTCHQAGGADDGIPSIVLWPEEDFVIAMHAYKNKQRPNPVMQMMAGRLSDEEIAALAAYFATLEE